MLCKQLDSLRSKLDRRHAARREAGGDRRATVAEQRVPTFDPDGGPGPATLMSRLMREELERQKYGGPMRALLQPSRWCW